MSLVVFAWAALLLGGLVAIGLEKTPRWSGRAGAAGAVVGGVCGLCAAIPALFRDSSASAFLCISWPLPGGTLSLGLDPLSAFFLIPIVGLGAVCAVYAAAYLDPTTPACKLSRFWFFYNLLLASMVLVVLARNALLFLLAWETMAISSFFLVMFENEKATTRTAGWIYLVATHLGTAFLLALFVLLGERAGSYEFDDWVRAGAGMPLPLAALAFVLALIGFGAKAGYIPLHVWLPEAHPAAPSPVSALMSGVMIKTGIYGLLRLLGCLGAPAAWWGWCLLAVGAISGVLGVLFALAQHDLKRLLAYHSVENIGIILLGLGLGYIGITNGIPVMAVLGFAGALLHVLNHALFKGLLFLGAGAILHSTGTGDLDRLGGLLKRMHVTGFTFLVGAAAICGLPPLNGFVSEFLIYLSAFSGLIDSPSTVVVGCLAAITSLALIGGLAAACFAKAFGMIFLGEARSEEARQGHEVNAGMRWPMIILASACAAIGLLAPVIAAALKSPVSILLSSHPELSVQSGMTAAASPLYAITATALLLISLAGALALFRVRLLLRRTVTESGTWDCGYAEPTARMQYTASSFAQPLTSLFRLFLGTRRTGHKPEGILPASASFATHPSDFFHNCLYGPLFTHAARVLACLRKAQHGRVQWYVFYVALTLLALLIFEIE